MPSPASDPASPSGSGDRRLVLVAGTGRSGTSTVAGIMQRLGLVVPKPEVHARRDQPARVLGVAVGGGLPRRPAEHANVQVSDARPLAWSRTGQFAERPGATGKLGRWLTEQLATGDDLLIKDPRLSWFLPLWTRRLAHARRRAVVRHDAPAARRGRRQQAHLLQQPLQDGHGVAAWLNMLLNTERATRGAAADVRPLPRPPDDWEGVIEAIDRDLGLSWQVTDDPRTRSTASSTRGCDGSPSTWDDLDLPERLESIARRTWDALDRLAGGGHDVGPRCSAELDLLHEEYGALLPRGRGGLALDA